MSYLPNTVLTRRETKGDALDVVHVVGISPIKQASLAEWSGATGEHVIVAPHVEFGSNEIVPLTVLQAQYEVTEIPEVEEPAPSPSGRGRVNQTLTPEQQFADAAREQTKAKKPKQAKPEPVTT